jgi:hypothetical protein
MIELPTLPYGASPTYGYTEAELRAYGEACARAALEAAAKACVMSAGLDHTVGVVCANAVRALIAPSSPSSSQTRS